MAEEFYGYGRWDAPYWFIGPEAGMSEDGHDDLTARLAAWKALGCGPVVDCASHHLGFGFTTWHQHHPPVQPTWRQLIRLLLAYKGKPADIESIRKYQRADWGRSTGESCVIELSGISAHSLRVPRDRQTFLSRRLDRIRKEAQQHRPEFILMYGRAQLAEWKKIAGGDFEADGFRLMGSALAAIAPHPVSHGIGNEFWEKLGVRIRGKVHTLNEP